MDIQQLFFSNQFQPILLAAAPQATVLIGFVIVVLLILSFFVSGAEVAFFSLTWKDINLLKTKQDSGWKRIVNLLEEPKQLLASLMVANSLVNIAIIILSNVMMDQVIMLQPNLWWAEFFIKVILIAALLILFGEILQIARLRSVGWQALQTEMTHFGPRHEARVFGSGRKFVHRERERRNIPGSRRDGAGNQ